MSSIAPWGSRMVPPPSVPTSIEGIVTVIWREPPTLLARLAYKPTNILSTFVDLLLHKGHAVGTFYNLCRVLSGSDEDGGDDVARMGIEASYRSGHGRSY